MCDPFGEGQTFVAGESLIAVADESDIGECPVDGFEPSDVLVDVVAHFHLEETKTFLIPASCQCDSLVAVANGDSDVCFAFT